MAAPPIAERHLHHFHRRSPIKESVRVATTANITIATALNNGDTLDGITLATDDRVLVKDQSTASQNGIYTVGVTPARAYDQSTDDPAFGFLVFVREGTAGAQTLWRNTNTSAPTIDSTSIAFAQIGGTTVATGVSVTDTAGYFTGTNVETVLAELGALVEGVTAHGNTGSTETFAATTGVHTATLNANCTFTFTALTSGLTSGMVLILSQDGTGSRLVTWPGSVVWPGGVAPTLSTAAASVDILTFLSVDGGTIWYGFPTGGSSGAPTTADYLVGTAQAGLSAEIVVGTTPGGELGGTWASPTVDATHSGSTHAATQAAAEATAAAALAAHVASSGGGGTHEHVDNIVFSGDGATTVWELPAAPVSATGIAVYVTGSRSIAWALSGTLLTTLTFDSAPASASNNIVIDIEAAVA